MKNITRALLMATAITCFGLGIQSSAGARTYVKEYQPGPTVPNDDPNLTDLGGGDDNVVVPEPGTLALLGGGLAALAAARKKRNNR